MFHSEETKQMKILIILTRVQIILEKFIRHQLLNREPQAVHLLIAKLTLAYLLVVIIQDF